MHLCLQIASYTLTWCVNCFSISEINDKVTRSKQTHHDVKQVLEIALTIAAPLQTHTHNVHCTVNRQKKL